jgi:hypothetical protein
MHGNVFVNEVRIPLDKIRSLKVLQYRASGLSTGHKKRLESLLATEQRQVSIFEGDVLFCLAAEAGNIEVEKERLSEFLSKYVRNFHKDAIHDIELGRAPERVVERLTFAIISFLAANRGIFTIYGRTLFKSSPKEGKLGHRAVETTMVIEDQFIKIYFTPSPIALINIQDTYRQERHDLELVALCQFRVGCDLAETDGSCCYVRPGRLGYYSQELSMGRISEERRESFRKAYEECPQILEANRVILAKASKKATNTLAYPPYIVHARLSKTDLQTRAETARLYRQETLMLSGTRWKWTERWLTDIFGDGNKLEIGDVEIPIEIRLRQAHPIQRKSNLDYRAIWIPEQQIVNDQRNPRGLSLSGGWLFANRGAYDREDINRPFEKVHPYLIAPNIGDIVDLTRRLLDIFSHGEYVARVEKGDQQFSGLNQPESLQKYSCQFVNVWDEEEDIFLVDGSEADYWRAVQDVKRDWNKATSKDLNRIAIVIVPASPAGDEESAVYYRLKKVFLEEGIPSQFITLDTLHDLGDDSVPFGPVLHSLWLNMYAKLGGKPWRLSNQLGNVHCFIGIGFGLNPRRMGKHIYAGVAHVFDRYGSWIDVASAWEHLSASDRENFEGPQRYVQGTSSFKISQRMTQDIVYDALRLYQQHQTVTEEPATNIVLHKLGRVHECEKVGFLEGIRQTLGTLSGCRLGILQIEQEHQIRLYGDEVKKRRKENRAVFRGTGLVFNDSKIVLATTGRIYRQTASGVQDYYPGIGTPQPLLITSRVPSTALLQRYGCSDSQFYSIETLAKHVMALTQLHWGSTRENIRLPITTLYAHKVADLISKTGATVDTWSSYHRPWFL